MIKTLMTLILTFFVVGLSEAKANCTLEFEIEGAIGPASLDLIKRAKHQAEEKNCTSVLATINTPGGNLQSTRIIVEEILNSKVPFLCLVGPAGGHAGSAGAIILQACHVAGAMKATNIGAATPIASTGKEIPEDLRKKLLNDTRSWMEGIAKLRGRDLKFAQDIVTEAKAVSASEAKKLGAIEWVGSKKSEFVEFSNGIEVTMTEDEKLKVVTGPIVEMPLDLRFQVLSFITNPQFAYFIFMGSLGLLYFELTHPGMIAPGVVGAIGLAISLVSMHMLNVEMGGLLLIFLGIALMILEAFVASFGILGIGGIVAFFLGSIFLFDPATSGVALPLSTILPTTLFLGAIMLGIAYLAFGTRKVLKQNTYDGLVGHTGTVAKVTGGGKKVQINIEGEIWQAKASAPVKVGDEVEVSGYRGLTLEVKTKTKEI